MAGAHLPQRTHTGVSDRKGYKGFPKPRVRDVAKKTTLKYPGTPDQLRAFGGEVAQGKATERRDGNRKSAKEDSRKRNGPEGNSKGSPPGGRSGASPATHMGDSGRGGPGKIGSGDGFKGKARGPSEDLSPAWFERLGAD